MVLSGQTRRSAGQQHLQRVAGIKDPGEVARVDLGNDDAQSRPDRHQPLPAQALYRLAHRGAAHLQVLHQPVFRHGLAGLQLQRDDVFLKAPVGGCRKAFLLCHVTSLCISGPKSPPKMYY